MRIAQVSLQFGPSVTGGGGHHVDKIVEQMNAMGHEMTVVSIHVDKTESLGEWSEVNGNQFSVCEENGVRIVRLLVEKGIEHPYVGNKTEELERIGKFSEAAGLWLEKNRHQFDVVHTHGHHYLCGPLPKKLASLGIKCVTTQHGIESIYEKEKAETGRSNVDTSVIPRLVEMETSIKYAHRGVCPSPMVREELIKLIKEVGKYTEDAGRRLVVTPSGVDEDSFMTTEQINRKLRTIPGKLYLLMLARIDPSKAMHVALDSLGSIAAEQKALGRQLHLTIAGRISRQDYFHELQERAKGYGDLQVEFHANVSEEHKRELYDRSHIYTMPTLRDHFGITLIESAVRGAITVTSDAIGPYYVMEGPNMNEQEWGYLTDFGVVAKKTDDVPRNFSGNLNAGFRWVLDNWDEARGKLIAFQDKIKERFTWRVIAERYLEQFKEVLG